MAHLFVLTDGAEIARRRRLLPPGHPVEAWPDVQAAGEYWVGETSKAALDSVGPPVPVKLTLMGEAIPIYYGPHLGDVDSLPLEESLRARVASAHGLAAAWITLVRFGQRHQHEPSGPADPVFYLRRPGGAMGHVWRLFRSRREACVFMAERDGHDRQGRDWAATLPVDSFAELLQRHGQPG